MTIIFSVPGKPVPQPRHKTSVRGGHARTYIAKDHGIHQWKAAILAVCDRIGCNRESLAFPKGSVSVTLTFSFRRPDSHWTTKGKLRRMQVDAIPTGDVDNLAKAVFDTLTDAGIWHDDKQVAECHIVKQWTTNVKQWNDREGVHITITNA